MNGLCSACFALWLLFACMPVFASAPTKVMITIDVESYAKGDPDKQIWGKQPDGEHGIRRIMDLLDKHGLKGTFYLNVYEAAKHGEPRLAEVARAIHQRGHDLQLHTHPGSMYSFRTMQQASFSQQLEALQRGKMLIHEWTGKTVVAHRAGAFAGNLDTIKASAAAGLTIDASLSPSSPGTQLARQLPPGNRPQVVDGVLELPVSYYAQLRFGNWQSLRLLDVEASSLNEFKSVIRQLRDEHAPVVTILMHSFSFVRSGSANPAMEQRFDQLLDFLVHEPGLEVVTVSQLPLNTLLQTSLAKSDKDPLPYTGLWLTYWRAVEHAREGGENLMVAASPLLVIILVGGALFFRRQKRTTP